MWYIVSPEVRKGRNEGVRVDPRADRLVEPKLDDQVTQVGLFHILHGARGCLVLLALAERLAREPALKPDLPDVVGLESRQWACMRGQLECSEGQSRQEITDRSGNQSPERELEQCDQVKARGRGNRRSRRRLVEKQDRLSHRCRVDQDAAKHASKCRHLFGDLRDDVRESSQGARL